MELPGSCEHAEAGRAGWMAKSNDMFVSINFVELLHESKFDEADKTGRKRRGGSDSWYRKCNKSWCPEENAYRGGPTGISGYIDPDGDYWF